MISKRIYDKINYTLLIIAFIGISTTKIALSWCTVLFFANFILGYDLKGRLQLIWQSSINRWIIAFIVINLLGLLWTPDLKAGIKLIKGYLPLLIIPLICSTTVISITQIQHMLRWFVAGLVFTSLFNFLYINGTFGPIVGDDIREMSRFGSHVRYAILIILGALVCLESIRKKSFELFPNYASIILISWFIFYTFYAQILSGVLALITLIIVYTLVLLWKVKQKIIFSLGLITLIITTLVIAFYLMPKTANEACEKLPEETRLGNKYDHNCSLLSEVNGKPIYAFYQEGELRETWSKRSKIDFYGLDKRNHPIRMTIVRYMTALDRTKDAEGMNSLSKEDIKNIEEGKVYPNENKDLLLTRIYSIKYELMYPGNPNGKSLLQRIEHWKASIHIIPQHEFIGVGTGGNQKAFDQAYEQLNSPLYPENRMRSHNMFFAVQIGLGLMGTFVFISLFATLLLQAFKKKILLSLIVSCILLTSFLIEDTLETQVGIYILSLFVLPLMQKAEPTTVKTT